MNDGTYTIFVSRGKNSIGFEVKDAEAPAVAQDVGSKVLMCMQSIKIAEDVAKDMQVIEP